MLAAPLVDDGPRRARHERPAICRELVRLVHGGFTVESADAPEGRRFRLLLAEDSAVNQCVAVAMLQKLGYDVDVAEDGRQVLQRLRTQHYDLILMDCQMPALDGYATTGIIRRDENGQRRVPIVAITASAMTGDRERCLAAGMDDYISKPVQRQTLGAILAHWLPHDPVRESISAPQHPTAALRAELARAFLEDADAQLASLESAVDRGDLEALRQIAHRIKGAAATVGAAAASRVAGQIEAGAALGEAAGLVAELRAEIREFGRAPGSGPGIAS